MSTEPRYDFTSCGADYDGMDAETKDALHQLVNAAGDRITAGPHVEQVQEEAVQEVRDNLAITDRRTLPRPVRSVEGDEGGL